MNKFKEIYRDLEEKILTHEYPANTMLPSESQLIKHYKVSRETVRKALTLLKNAGYIQKQQGKGSIVLDINRFNFPVSGLTSYKEVRESQQISGETNVVELKKIAVSKELSKITGWNVAAEAWKLVRQRKIDDEIVILDRDYLLTDIVSTLPQKEAENSIYEYFEDHLNLDISYAKKEITVEPATKGIRELMDLLEDTHVVVIRSLVYLEDTRCFEYTESIHRLDKFRFVEFARRKRV
ncbi:trehalose operon repressor [Vagococcus vulneris]|uniref:Trehalose operon repressor n=1 Tax=Vagococcus vulneris TaxID=1977869 RepID=A0A430A286_9ENTE|nr:trehalose operon repressor [Vagococcus vulneris]RSU00558.1 trehalose operon repressor [Vagococcus vulneris]